MPAQDIAADRNYFAKRAKDERDKAAVCEDNAAALVHLRLAEEYDRRAEAVAMPHSATS